MVQSGKNRFLAAFLDPSHGHWFHGGNRCSLLSKLGRKQLPLFENQKPDEQGLHVCSPPSMAILEAFSVTYGRKTKIDHQLGDLTIGNAYTVTGKSELPSATTGICPVFRSVELRVSKAAFKFPPSVSGRSVIDLSTASRLNNPVEVTSYVLRLTLSHRRIPIGFRKSFPVFVLFRGVTRHTKSSGCKIGRKTFAVGISFSESAVSSNAPVSDLRFAVPQRISGRARLPKEIYLSGNLLFPSSASFFHRDFVFFFRFIPTIFGMPHSIDSISAFPHKYPLSGGGDSRSVETENWSRLRLVGSFPDRLSSIRSSAQLPHSSSQVRFSRLFLPGWCLRPLSGLVPIAENVVLSNFGFHFPI